VRATHTDKEFTANEAVNSKNVLAISVHFQVFTLLKKYPGIITNYFIGEKNTEVSQLNTIQTQKGL